VSSSGHAVGHEFVQIVRAIIHAAVKLENTPRPLKYSILYFYYSIYTISLRLTHIDIQAFFIPRSLPPPNYPLKCLIKLPIYPYIEV